MNTTSHTKSIPARKKRYSRRRRHLLYKRLTLIVSCILLGCAIGAGVWFLAVQNGVQPSINMPLTGKPVSELPFPSPQPVVTTLSVAACGDNLIHDGLYLDARARADGEGIGYDFDALYENIAPFFSQYDINWINQETLISDDFLPSGYPMFCSPTAVVNSLYNIGFRVFALSNNHSYDKGAAGIASSHAFWQSMTERDATAYGLYEGVADAQDITVQTVNGIKIAYLAYTEHTNGLPTPQDAVAHVIYTSQTDVIEQQLRKAHTMADIVIASVHWGTENSHVVNDAQRTLAQQMANWGADVIIGTHPHVVQGIEILTSAENGKQVPVYYCLGNFVSLQMQTDNLLGIIGTFNITKTAKFTGETTIAVDNVKAVPIVMHYESGYKNGRVYLLSSYTTELAARHGAHANNSVFSIAYFHQLLEKTFDSDILAAA